MKQISIIIVFYLSIFITITSCKGQEKENLNKDKVATDQHTITESGVYYYKPNLKKIDSLKKTLGEDNFYTIADDNNAYFSEILQKLGDKMIKIKANYIYFANEDVSIDLDTLNDNWGIIEYVKGEKPKIFSFVDYNLILNEKVSSNNSIQNDTSIRIDNTSLYVGQKEYKGFVINEMAVNTYLKTEGFNIFYLIYDYTASSIKRQVAYKYYYDKEVYLIYKESISFGKEGTKSYRIYFQDYKLNNTNFEKLEAINFDEKLLFSSNTSAAQTAIVNFNGKTIGSISYSITNQELFTSFPIVENLEKVTENFKISSVEDFNNIAYNYEQLGNYSDAIFILEKIIKQYPNRIVAFLNLGDAQWQIEKNEEAKQSYLKYIDLMKKNNKNLDKIPVKVYERIK
ncbi:tetratricopeptide repeat protein [Flavobacterium sp. J27]|uniref:tetratricopeptide repeat protein n=1 Tax=Flavobacterium sp. J27 TaxID=2060419 RepID=UPI0013EE8146|nr:tetratricopeptide repeat protein [Flavobacterium sp. J27]